MQHKVEENTKTNALLFATGVFFVLFGGVVALALFYDFSSINLEGLLFLISFLCCIFIAKNLYDLAVDATDEALLTMQSVSTPTQSLYTQLYQKSPVPYFVIDIDGRVTSANTSAARLLGLKQNKVIGVNLFELLSTEESDHKDFIINKFHSGVAVSDEMVRITREDRREAWGLLSLFQFVNDFNEQQGLLTLVDITKQKKAEDAKSEFVSLASHQLRTPIAGMKWSAELMQLDSPDTLTERQLKYMDRLMVSINRMSILVDDFLRVSRFELGSFRAVYETVVPSQLCTDIITEMHETTKRKGVKVETDFDDTVKAYVTDINLLRMIVSNLFANAVKYTPVDGTVTLMYKHEGNMLRIKVSDTGMGIPAQDQGQIFSKLFRASNAVRDVPDGTGLGLYIVREAVTVLRGKVSFTSVEGMGTTFDVQLPFEVPTDF